MVELHDHDPEEIFLALDKRSGGKACFYRVPGYCADAGRFIERVYSAARAKGAAVEGPLPNPDEKQVSFYTEILGSEFHLDRMFIGSSLGRWLPRLDNKQCTRLADAVYDSLVRYKALGKNDAMVKNMYVRLLCQMYYGLQSIIAHIGENEPPKLLYSGALGKNGLSALELLNACGCDVVLIQNRGEQEYDSLDERGRLSVRLSFPDMGEFPEGYGVASLDKAFTQREQTERLRGLRPTVRAATNIWLSGTDILGDIRRLPVTRGKDEHLFYNAFCRVSGVEDKLTYQNELYKFYIEIKNSGRRFAIVQNKIPMPTNEELERIDRRSFETKEQLVGAMLKCVLMPPNEELKRLMASAFVDVLLDEADKPGMTQQRLTTMAACTACWLNRSGPTLLNGWAMPLVSLLIYFGGCKSVHEAAFLRMLSRLPCDVLILSPNLNTKCQLEDDKLFELQYTQSMNLTEFPTETSTQQFGTAAYHAERELDEALYAGTGIYRDYQYKKANSVVLKTMFEEIEILWKQETKFRPNFSVIDDTVNVPVIFAKISGVKDSQPAKYWKSVQQLMTENTFVIYSAPFITRETENPMKFCSAQLIRGGRLQRNAILQNRAYRYRHLREETQTYIFDKIDLLMNSHLISGTYENGTEYLIAATLLYLPDPIIKLIQGFDFTKVSPKIIYINLGEIPITLEDSILTAFLSLCGFDVLFLVPTGYRTVENFFSKNILDEHKIGEYMYDLQAPKLKVPKPKPSAAKSKPLFGGIFRKGK